MRILTFLATCAVAPLSMLPAAALAQDQTTPAPAPTDQTAPAPGTTTTTTTPAPDTSATPMAASDGTANTSSSNGSTFRGLRLAGQVGYDRFQALGNHHDNVGYGGELGWDGQLGPVLIGPSVSYWRGDDSQVCAPQSGGNACTRDFREVAATVRAGFQLGDTLLIYGKGGYVTDYQRKFFNSSAPGGAGSYYRRYNADGWQVGGGAEFSLGRHFFVDAEYRFSQLNDHTSRQRALAGFGVRF